MVHDMVVRDLILLTTGQIDAVDRLGNTSYNLYSHRIRISNTVRREDVATAVITAVI